MARLTAEQRRQLKPSDYVYPKERAFPIHDKAHAKAALILSGRKGPDVQKKVRAAVKRRFPDLVSDSKK